MFALADVSVRADDVRFLRQSRHWRSSRKHASGNLRRVRIRDIQLPAAKVSNPNFAGKSGNSPDISKGISQSGMCKFESSQVSHAVGPEQTWPMRVAEKPANSGLSQFGRRSPDSQFPELPAQNADSLWLFIEIFPFSGDAGRRPGSICTAAGLTVQTCQTLRLCRPEIGRSIPHCAPTVTVRSSAARRIFASCSASRRSPKSSTSITKQGR